MKQPEQLKEGLYVFSYTIVWLALEAVSDTFIQITLILIKYNRLGTLCCNFYLDYKL